MPLPFPRTEGAARTVSRRLRVSWHSQQNSARVPTSREENQSARQGSEDRRASRRQRCGI